MTDGRGEFAELSSRRAKLPATAPEKCMIQRRLGLCAAVLGVALTPASALAWGDEGHQITGLIAYAHLTTKTRTRVDAILASDPDTLTAPDFPSRATWADKYRNSHRETAEWHFVDLEIDKPDLQAACFNFPALAPGQAASSGPAKDCVVDKVEQFAAELRSPATPAAEQRLALKFLIHFVGDLHQPLHASDHEDRGGNCIDIASIAGVRSSNLHAYWDTGVVQGMGGSPAEIAATLERGVTSMQIKGWSRGDAKTWAKETFLLAQSLTYQLPSRPTCAAHGAVTLSDAYRASARQAATTQLQKAGIRIAYVLNQTLGR
jgi:hypothetical protein